MARLERKLLYDSLLVGAGITLLVILCDLAGLLTPLENWLYDHRARWCQFYLRKPTQQLVHLGIDDETMKTLGPWPWPRESWAEMLEELRLAGPKAVEFDVGFADTKSGDDHLASSVSRMGSVIVPISFLNSQPNALQDAAAREVGANLTMDAASLLQLLRQRGVSGAAAVTEGPAANGLLLAARRQAIFERLRIGASRGEPLAASKAALLSTVPTDQRLFIEPLVEEQSADLHAALAVHRLGWVPASGELPTRMPETVVQPMTVPSISEAAAGGAFVNYEPLGGGVVRSIPLVVSCDGRLYAGMGLRLACAMWGTPLERIRLTEHEIIVPRMQGADELRIPVRSASESAGAIGPLVEVPWWGTRTWETMYDRPQIRSPAFIAVNAVWRICLVSRRIRANDTNVDRAVAVLLDDKANHAALDPEKAANYLATNPSPDDTLAREAIAATTLNVLEATPLKQQLAHLQNPTPAEQVQRQEVLAADGELRRVPPENRRLVALRDSYRTELHEFVHGKAVLVGWLATGATDMVSTSLHDRCPGVVVHGAVFNGLMTGELWRRAPIWAAAIITLVLGLTTAFITGYFSAVRALTIALVLAAAYAVLNGIVLFDWGDRIVGAAGPLVAIGFVWAGCGVTRAIVETAERNRITRRFQSYVDPELVNYVLEHPEDARLEGQSREMTVVFTDLAGFTTLSEQLKEKVVPILNEFLGRMVPIIRRHRGYVNKFLGDGIMFFMGAPAQNPNHGSDAVAAICEMQNAVAAFSREMEARGLPVVKMRAGVATGHMVVGDAGSADASDYTVLGDTVNFAARLQSANKATDTLTLVSARTAELLGDRFLLRPVGKLRVVGKTEGMSAFELIGPAESATERDRRCVEATRTMVESFLAARFADAIVGAVAVEGEFGRSELTEMYRELSERYLQNPPANGFDGTIVLTEK